MMKSGFSVSVKTGVMAVLISAAAAGTMHAVADDTAVAVTAPPAQEQVIRVAAFRVGGLRSGNVMMISNMGTEIVKSTMVAQQLAAPRQSPFAEFCKAF